MLEPAGLQNNGGPTQTMALQPNSPAIDKGKDLVYRPDQRETQGRFVRKSCDVTNQRAKGAAVTESGNPKSGIIFTAPASGASGTFSWEHNHSDGHDQRERRGDSSAVHGQFDCRELPLSQLP